MPELSRETTRNMPSKIEVAAPEQEVWTPQLEQKYSGEVKGLEKTEEPALTDEDIKAKKEGDDDFRMVVMGFEMSQVPLSDEKRRLVTEVLIGNGEDTEALDEINERIAINLANIDSEGRWTETVVNEQGEEEKAVGGIKSQDLIKEIVGNTIVGLVAEWSEEDEAAEHLNFSPEERRQIAEGYLRADWRNLQNKLGREGVSDRPIQVILEMNGEAFGERGGQDIDDLRNLVAGYRANPAGLTVKGRLLVEKLEDILNMPTIPGVSVTYEAQKSRLKSWVTQNLDSRDIPDELKRQAALGYQDADVSYRRDYGARWNEVPKMPETDETVTMIREEMLILVDRLRASKNQGLLRSPEELMQALLRRVARRSGIREVALTKPMEVEVMEELSARGELAASDVYWHLAKTSWGSEENAYKKAVEYASAIPTISESTYKWLINQRDYLRTVNGVTERVDLSGNISRAGALLMTRMLAKAEAEVVRLVEENSGGILRAPGQSVDDLINIGLKNMPKIEFWKTFGDQKIAEISAEVQELRAQGINITEDEVGLIFSLADAEFWAATTEPLHPFFRLARFGMVRRGNYRKKPVPVPGGERLAVEYRTNNYTLRWDKRLERQDVPYDAFFPEGIRLALSGLDVVGGLRLELNPDPSQTSLARKYMEGPAMLDYVTVVEAVTKGYYFDLIRPRFFDDGEVFDKNSQVSSWLDTVNPELRKNIIGWDVDKDIFDPTKRPKGSVQIQAIKSIKGAGVFKTIESFPGKVGAKEVSMQSLKDLKGGLYSYLLEIGFPGGPPMDTYIGRLMDEWCKTFVWGATLANPTIYDRKSIDYIVPFSVVLGYFGMIVSTYESTVSEGVRVTHGEYVGYDKPELKKDIQGMDEATRKVNAEASNTRSVERVRKYIEWFDGFVRGVDNAVIRADISKDYQMYPNIIRADKNAVNSWLTSGRYDWMGMNRLLRTRWNRTFRNDTRRWYLPR